MPCAQAASQPCPTGTPSTKTTYDGLNRPLLIIDGGGGTTSYSYATNDVLQTIGPAPNNSKQMEYDGLGRLTSVCELTSGTGSGTCSQGSPQTGFWTRYGYDVLGNLTGVTQNAQGSPQETRSYSYDSLGRMTSETNPETGNTTYTYDSVNTGVCVVNNPGDLVLKTNPATGVSACYVSDAIHRVLSIGHNPGLADNTPDKYFVYDSATVNNVVMGNAKGHLAEAYTCVTAAPCAKVTDIGFVYSQRGENTETWESTPHSGGYYHPTAAYWANGALNNLWMSGLPSISFGAEGEGRTSTVSATSGQNPVTGVTYVTSGTTQPIGSLTQVTFGSGDSDSFSYDTNTGRMKQYTYTVNGRAEVGSLGWNANSTLATLGISDPFNAANAQNCSYAYDDLARLQSVNCPSVWAQSFNYDAFGNTTKSGNSSWMPLYNTKNQYQSIPGFPNPGPTYDANGDILTDSFHNYTWDADGHVLAIDSTGLTYDALGRMIEQDQSGTYFQIVYSPMGKKLAVMKGQTIQQAFVPLPGGTTAEYLSWGLSYYRHPDWLGSERLESSTSHSIPQDTAYAPFGEPYAELSGGNGDISFTGQNKDTDWLNYDFMYREYDPRQSRWLSPDPSGLDAVDPGDPQSWNRYAYVLNNPLKSVDPDGRADCALYIHTQTWDDGWHDSGTEGLFCDDFHQNVQRVIQAVTNWVKAPRDPGCMAGAMASGSGIGMGIGGLAGMSGLVGGPAVAATEPAGLQLGFTIGATGGTAVGYIKCQTGSASGTGGGSGGGGGLSGAARKKLGNLASRAGEKVRDVILSRGGTASNVNQVGPWADRTLGEVAQAAVDGDETAETAIKVAKQAARLGQQY